MLSRVMPLPVVVLASGEGTNLQALIDGPHSRGIIVLVGVASDKCDAPALDRARSAGLEAACFPTSDFTDRRTRDEALGDWIGELGAELIVSAGYMQLLDSGFVERFRDRVINVHPSLLPAFPGIDAIGQALEAGVTETGVTVHFVDDGVDTGRIIASRPVSAPSGISRQELEAAVHMAEHELLPEVVEDIATGRVSSGVRATN